MEQMELVVEEVDLPKVIIIMVHVVDQVVRV